jgi:hypothetical protein
MHSAGVMMQPTPARATKVLLQLVEAKERAVDAGGGFEPNMFKFGCGSMTRNPRGVDPAALGVRCDGTEGQTAHSVDSPVQPHFQKYFGSRLTQIKSITRAVSPHTRGVSRSSRTRGGMRWTRATSGAHWQSQGELNLVSDLRRADERR